MNYSLEETVYHKDVYDYREPLKVVGTRKDQLELQGDYSGGTHNVSQVEWLSIEGVSRIYDYGTKKAYRDRILAIQKSIPITAAHPIPGIPDTVKPGVIVIVDSLFELIQIGLKLTKEVK